MAFRITDKRNISSGITTALNTIRIILNKNTVRTRTIICFKKYNDKVHYTLLYQIACSDNFFFTHLIYIYLIVLLVQKV